MKRDEIATRLGWTRNDMVDVVEKIVQAAVDAEREACAKVCDQSVDAEYATGKVDHNEIAWTQFCAIAIRARSV